MKHFTLLLLLLFTLSSLIDAQVSINESGNNPDSSAVLDVQSSSKGLLLPRMSIGDLQTIENPANGLIVYCTTNDRLYIYSYSSGVWKDINFGSETVVPIKTVYNPITGETWMDKNLGASRVATTIDDSLAYGDLYQWGRAADGHEKRTSLTSTNKATTPIPNLGNSWDGLFITMSVIAPNDWLQPQVASLWQGVNGINNICPTGFRLPTEAEWEAERVSWTSNDAAGAFGSILKLPGAKMREITGGIYQPGTIYGGYWSSDIYWSSFNNGYYSIRIRMLSSAASTGLGSRGDGYSVRCIKD